MRFSSFERVKTEQLTLATRMATSWPLKGLSFRRRSGDPVVQISVNVVGEEPLQFLHYGPITAIEVFTLRPESRFILGPPFLKFFDRHVIRLAQWVIGCSEHKVGNRDECTIDNLEITVLHQQRVANGVTTVVSEQMLWRISVLQSIEAVEVELSICDQFLVAPPQCFHPLGAHK